MSTNVGTEYQQTVDICSACHLTSKQTYQRLPRHSKLSLMLILEECDSCKADLRLEELCRLGRGGAHHEALSHGAANICGCQRMQNLRDSKTIRGLDGSLQCNGMVLDHGMLALHSFLNFACPPLHDLAIHAEQVQASHKSTRRNDLQSRITSSRLICLQSNRWTQCSRIIQQMLSCKHDSQQELHTGALSTMPCLK